MADSEVPVKAEPPKNSRLGMKITLHGRGTVVAQKPPYSEAQQKFIEEKHQEWISDNKTYVDQNGWRADYKLNSSAESSEGTVIAPSDCA